MYHPPLSHTTPVAPIGLSACAWPKGQRAKVVTAATIRLGSDEIISLLPAACKKLCTGLFHN
jgi:hypothetical protein